ncbi:MAG TPA: cytochrome c [Puia sp.]|jgi:mono/diheme cytochrome c family protein|nr:cytochrome c [Puia sp.]
MKRILKIAKWTGLILLTLFTGLSLTIASRQNLHYDAPYPDIHASTDSAVIARGKHLVYSSAHCIDCHQRANADSLIALGQEVPLSGGVLFDLPVGKIYSKNITPDKETGIGRYTDVEIARALRYGVHPDGTVVYDFMPFHNTSDEDLTAMISYLRAQRPVHNAVPDHQLNLMGNAVKAFLVKPTGPVGEVPRSVSPDTTAVYGRYIAMHLAECNGCHTKRDMAGAVIGEPFGGGNNIEGFITPNLTPDPTGRIYKWTKRDFISRFRKGKLIPGSPMPWRSFGRMTDEELTALYNFLKSLKPVHDAPAATAAAH